MESDSSPPKIVLSLRKKFSLRPHWYSDAAKRLIDILSSAIGLLLLSPAFCLLAFLIKRDSPGPAFYRGPRKGKNGKVFGILKFRTMYERDASYCGPRVTAKDDDRTTPFGKWLRHTKLNELPQLWNVLVGEMSLVGPRPEDPEIVATWPSCVRREILSVRPGITSPASVAYHDEESRLKAASVMEDYLEHIVPDKLRLDQLYVRHHTFITDLDTLFWTFVILIPRMGDQKISEGWLFGGPITRLLRRYVGWTLIDFLLAFASIGLVGIVWRLGGPLDIGLWRSVEIAVLVALLFGFFNTLLGLKTVVWSRAGAEDVLRLIVSCGLVTLTLVLIQARVIPGHGMPTGFMFTAGLTVLASFVAARYRLRLLTGLATRWINLRNRGYGAGERVLVVGAGKGSAFASWLLRHTDFRRLYAMVGIVDDDPAKQGMRYDGLKVLGTTADIPELVRRYDIDVIFYAIVKISFADRERVLAACGRTGLPVIMLPDLLRSLHSHLTFNKADTQNNFPFWSEAENSLEVPMENSDL